MFQCVKKHKNREYSDDDSDSEESINSENGKKDKVTEKLIKWFQKRNINDNNDKKSNNEFEDYTFKQLDDESLEETDENGEKDDIYFDNESDSSYFETLKNKDLEEKVTLTELIFNIFQMGIYGLDILSDTYLAIDYIIKEKYLYAILTLSVIYVAAGIDAYFNRSELRRETTKNKYYWYVVSIIFNTRGLDVYKNLVKLKWNMYRGINAKKETQEDFFDRNFRVANLKLHEGLFEACPQLLLQLYILLVNIDENKNQSPQILSVLISLCSLAMTFITGDKARRLYEYEADKFSNWGLALQFLWIFPVTASRIISLSCIASVYPILSMSAFAIHIFIAFLFLRITQFYTSFGALVAAIRIFLTPYEPIEEYDDEVGFRLFRSHTVHLIGNIMSISIWAINATQLYQKQFPVYVSILFFFAFGFVIGVLSLRTLLYYRKDCFVQDGELESVMDQRMRPYIDFKSHFTRVQEMCRIICFRIRIYVQYHYHAMRGF